MEDPKLSPEKEKLSTKATKRLIWTRNKLGIEPETDWNQVLANLFDRMAWMDQSDESKGEISQSITESIKTGKLYWIEIILSSIIATLGLLQNSVAVILGAMLIAPLLRPIQAIAFSIATGRSHLFLRSSRLLIGSIILSVGIAVLVCKLFIPVVFETPEILARTGPNILDLWIAIASAIIALLAFAYKRFYSSVAGVAMATSLMPPLAVVGIELFLGQEPSAWNAFILFSTNLLAVVIVGVVMFILYGFNPHATESKKTVRNLSILVTLIIALAILLNIRLGKIVEQQQQDTQIQTALQQTLPEDTPFRNFLREGQNVSFELVIPESEPKLRKNIQTRLKTLQEGFEPPLEIDYRIFEYESIEIK